MNSMLYGSPYCGANEKHPSEYSLQDVIDRIEIDPKDAEKGYGSLSYNIDGIIVSFDFKTDEEGYFEVVNLVCDQFNRLDDLKDDLEEKLWVAWHSQPMDVFKTLGTILKPE